MLIAIYEALEHKDTQTTVLGHLIFNMNMLLA